MKEEYLIAGLKRKDEVVFDFIFKYYYTSLCSYALNYVKQDSAAEDIVQTFFVRLWTRSEKLELNTSIKNYLFSSIKNSCLDFIKHQHVANRFSEWAKNNIDNHTPEMYVESELEELLKKATSKLPTRCKEVFELSRFSGLSNQEIADQLDISKRTVEKHITNALEILRVELKDYLPLFIITFLLK